MRDVDALNCDNVRQGGSTVSQVLVDEELLGDVVVGAIKAYYSGSGDNVNRQHEKLGGLCGTREEGVK